MQGEEIHFSELSCFSPATLLKNELFHRIISKVIDCRLLLSGCRIHELLLQIRLVWNQPLEIMVKFWKISYKEVHF